MADRMTYDRYITVYKQSLKGLKWDKEKYQVHHLDLDITNDDIDNLVLIPRLLHQRFHHLVRELENKDIYFPDLTSPSISFETYQYADKLKKLIDYKCQIFEYDRLKEDMIRFSENNHDQKEVQGFYGTMMKMLNLKHGYENGAPF